MSAPDYQGEDLSLEQVRHVLDELVSCGIRSLSITDGEPLVHPRFYEILDEIAKRNIGLSTIYSNGTLVDETLLDKLEKRGTHPSIHMSFVGAGRHE